MRRNQLSFAAERHISELRDTADQDYLLARVAFRYELDPSFIWLAHQAVEKYLKALLLFNGLNARDLGHNLRPAVKRVLTISDIPFNFPPVVQDLVEYLDQRANRYAEFSYSVSTKRLVALDSTVWHLRRFCLNVRGNSHWRLRVSAKRVREQIARRARGEFTKQPYTYHLIFGFLERVRETRNSPLKQQLTWNNLYFSRRKHTSVSASRDRSVNSWLVLYPHIIPELRNRLLFSEEVKHRMRAI